MLEKTPESLLNWKEIQPVHHKGKQSWIFIGRTDVEAGLQYFGHLMLRNNSLEKILMLWKIECWRRRGRQDVMVGWHQQLNGHESLQALGDGKGQGSLACYSPWGRKKLHLTEWLNNNLSWQIGHWGQIETNLSAERSFCLVWFKKFFYNRHKKLKKNLCASSNHLSTAITFFITIIYY